MYWKKGLVLIALTATFVTQLSCDNVTEKVLLDSKTVPEPLAQVQIRPDGTVFSESDERRFNINRDKNRNADDKKLRNRIPGREGFSRIPQNPFINQRFDPQNEIDVKEKRPDFGNSFGGSSDGNLDRNSGRGVSSYASNNNFPSNRNLVNRLPRYFVVASKTVRPGQLYRLAVTIFETPTQKQQIEVRASLLRNGVDIGSDTKLCQPNIPETLMIRVPKTSVMGEYKVRVEGNDNGLVGGTAFVNETELIFSQRSMTIFIQTDKPVYMQGQSVRFRVLPINMKLLAFNDAVDVYMIDPKGNVVRRWLSRQSNFGAVSLNYLLSDQPVFGKYKIRVQALQQIEEKSFIVEEYYQTRFEVNVTMPAFVFNTEPYLSGIIVANYTSGAPVRGNLTITATIRPVLGPGIQPQTYAGSLYEPKLQQLVHNFQGHYHFYLPMYEISQSVSQTDNIEVTVTASVGDHFWDRVIEGFSKARIYNSSLRLQFLGGSPQVFKPSMPYTCYMTVSYHDGSPLPLSRLSRSHLEIQPEVVMRSGGRRRLEARQVKMVPEHPGIWKVTFNLKLEVGGPRRSRQRARVINDIQSLRVAAVFTNTLQDSATAELLAVAHYSPKNRHIRVTTSTSAPKVGEYIVFHVRSNFYMERFSYLIVSKGVILLSGNEMMDSTIRTFAISVSPEMAPAATMVVYHISRYNQVVADSLAFPVNGISRNNFTVKINNKKEKTNNVVEVIVRGEPGAYVGLAGVDSSFYTMQAGNDISYGEVLSKMITFDEESNGTLVHKWISREGLPNEVVYFPSHSFGIDANRTFEYSGLVVFSDVGLPRKQDFCNETAGIFPCLTGSQCYLLENKCDGVRNCNDGTDESNCQWLNETDIIEFKLYRSNRMKRLYDNVWLWEDINIGPHGHFIFTLPVPKRPALWMISSTGVSPQSGFGLLRSPLDYSGVRPLFMDVEMPRKCRQGEQVGIRVTVFNYMMKDIEVMVVLGSSPKFRFIHVEPYGVVNSYNPRTSYGEHQHLVWIRAQDVVQVHIPIVSDVLGDIEVKLRLIGQIARDEVTRTLTIEPDGVPQYRHTSVLLDLSNRAFVLQYMHINVTESPIIPYDFDRYYVFSSNIAEISVVGDVVGPAFPTMPVNASSLLDKPMDSAEQNMFSFAANLYTLMYLRLTSQRNKTLSKEAFEHLNVAYLRQLSFQNEDGSFSHFRSDWNNSAPSVWVTAYCARVFSEASFNEWENFLYIDINVTAKAIDWLMQYQTAEGSFYEVSPYFNRKLNDTVVQNDWTYSPNITLTAHVLIALNRIKNLPGVIGAKMQIAKQRAVIYLEKKVDEMKYGARPYSIALVTYALMLSKSPKADAAFILLSEHAMYEGGLAYWGPERVPVPDYKLENNKPFLLPRLPHKYDSENVETTAYALMIYVTRQEPVLVEPIVKWLNTQRLHYGGWASTQDTAAAMRALIDYTIRSNIRNVTDITVSVEAVAMPQQITTFRVNAGNLARPQALQIPNAYGTVKVQAKGAGFAILQMKTQYGVDRARFVTDPPVHSFSLETWRRFTGRNASLIEYESCQSWTYLEESERSGMAVLDVRVPTGYFVLQSRLDQYVLSGQVPNLRRARYSSDSVYFYFDYLEKRPTCINFTLERWFPVANMTRYLPIRIYDYYAPERFNETIFDAFDVFILDICQVCGSYQCPYCPIFAASSSLKPSISVISLFIFILGSSNIYFKAYSSFIKPPDALVRCL